MKLQDRDYEILEWLVQMKFMLLYQIAKLFFPDCNPNRAPYRRLLKLMKAGLIETRKVYSEDKDLYIATKRAVKLLSGRGGPYALSGLSKDKHFTDYEHDKAIIDLRILFRELGIGMWVPERVLRSVRAYGSCPDAALITPNYLYAIEYERTEKRAERYKEICRRYDRGNYHAVLYVCRNEYLIKKLQKKYFSSHRFYFSTFEDLMTERGKAAFFSWTDVLPVHYLVSTSADIELNDFPRDILQWFLRPKGDWTTETPTPVVRPSKDFEDKNTNDHDGSDFEKGRKGSANKHINSEEEDAFLDKVIKHPEPDEAV